MRTVSLSLVLSALLIVAVARPQEGEPVTGGDLQRELGLLRSNAWAVAKLIDRLEGKPESSRRTRTPVAIPEGPASRESFDRWLNAAKADLFADFHRLNRLVHAPEPCPPPGTEIRFVRWNVTGNKGSHEIALPADSEVKNFEIAVHNRGKTVVVNPWIVVNGRGDWYSTRSILSEILSDGMSDREKALAVYEFVRDNRYHYEPPHGSGENHDPAKFINVYGYGFCDDSSSNFTALIQAAGLKGRVWGLSGHVVPEVWFEDGWHMLDPDGKAYYCYPDKNTIASIADIVAHPEILSQPEDQYYGVEMLTRIYTTTDNNRVHDWYLTTLSTEHTMGIELRPGESLVRSWGNRGIYYCGNRYDEPPEYGNGRIIFRPRFQEDLYRIGAKEARNLKAAAGGVAPAGKDTTAALTYAFKSPYLLLAGNVNIGYEVREPGTEVRISVRTVGSDWRPVGQLTTGAAGQAEVSFPLDRCFVNGYGDPTYGISVRLELSCPGKGTPLVLRELEYDLDFQCAPKALPALAPGANRVTYRSDSADKQDVVVEHRIGLAAGD